MKRNEQDSAPTTQANVKKELADILANSTVPKVAMVSLLVQVERMLEARTEYIADHPEEGCMDAEAAEAAIEPIVDTITEYFRDMEDFSESLMIFSLSLGLTPEEQERVLEVRNGKDAEDIDEAPPQKTGQFGLSIVLAKHDKRDPNALKRTVESALSEYAVELRDGGLPNIAQSAEHILGIVENKAKEMNLAHFRVMFANKPTFVLHSREITQGEASRRAMQDNLVH